MTLGVQVPDHISFHVPTLTAIGHLGPLALRQAQPLPTRSLVLSGAPKVILVAPRMAAPSHLQTSAQTSAQETFPGENLGQVAVPPLSHSFHALTLLSLQNLSHWEISLCIHMLAYCASAEGMLSFTKADLASLGLPGTPRDWASAWKRVGVL